MKNIKRVRYFHGQLLSPEDFQAEQDYLIDTRRLRNRFLYPPGVVSGLNVSVNQSGIYIGPGIAVDKHGNLIVVDEQQVLPLPVDHAIGYLAISHVELLSDPVPVPDGDGQQYSRIEETYSIEFLSEFPKDKVVLAKLRIDLGKWRVERPAKGWFYALALVLLTWWVLAPPVKQSD